MDEMSPYQRHEVDRLAEEFASVGVAYDAYEDQIEVTCYESSPDEDGDAGPPLKTLRIPAERGWEPDPGAPVETSHATMEGDWHGDGS